MRFTIPSDHEIFSYGCKLAGFDQAACKSAEKVTKTDLEKFRSCFVLYPHGIRSILQDLNNQAMENGSRPPKLKELLALANFMMEYRTERAMSGQWKMGEKTLRRQINLSLDAVVGLKDLKIKFEFDDNETFICSVDGTHCRILEPRSTPSTIWYSHKFKQPGLAYEVALNLWKPQVMNVSGWFPAGETDLTMYNSASGLGSKMPEGKKVFADGAYESIPECVTRMNACETGAVKAIRKRALARQESFFSRLKVMNIFRDRFRSHSKDRFEQHEKFFLAACILIQYDMENGAPLMEI